MSVEGWFSLIPDRGIFNMDRRLTRVIICFLISRRRDRWDKSPLRIRRRMTREGLGWAGKEGLGRGGVMKIACIAL
jgi:hypothetical protein